MRLSVILLFLLSFNVQAIVLKTDFYQLSEVYCEKSLQFNVKACTKAIQDCVELVANEKELFLINEEEKAIQIFERCFL